MLKAIDIFGSSVSLRSQTGSKYFQSTFGGIVSLLVIFVTGGISIFFLNIFVSRVESTIISNFKTSTNVYIPDFQNFPFMLKFSLTGAAKIEFPEKTWRLLPFLYTMDPKISTAYNLTKINYERCTKDRFKGYDDLIKDIYDLEDYFCLDFGNSKFDLIGPYGSSEFHQFINFRIRGCYEENEGIGKCLSPEQVDKITSDMYIDIRILNTNIIHDSINPKQNELLGQRIQISNTIFKRIFLKINTVDYTTDFGYLFESQETLHINQYNDYTTDSVFKFYNDPSNKSYYKVFTMLNIMNNQTKIFYKRSYMKAQTLLANIGGIFKGIAVIAQMLNYLISKRLFDEELCNEVNINLQNIIKKESEKGVQPKQDNTNKLENLQLDFCNIKNKGSTKHDLNFIKLRFHETLLPLVCFCNKQKKKMMIAALNIIQKNLTIHNVFRKLQEFEAIKRCILSEDELIIFENVFKNKKEIERNSIFIGNNNADASNINLKKENLVQDLLGKLNNKKN